MVNFKRSHRRSKEEETEESEKIFKEIMAETPPNLMKDINLQIQEVQQTPNRLNFKKIMP